MLKIGEPHSHLGGQAAVSGPQRIHFCHLRISGAHEFIVFTDILIQHERCNAHGNRVLHILVDVIHGYLPFFAFCLADLSQR